MDGRSWDGSYTKIKRDQLAKTLIITLNKKVVEIGSQLDQPGMTIFSLMLSQLTNLSSAL
jgi:hypothetical protein